MKLFGKNCAFIIIVMITLLCVWKKDNALPMDVVSYSDSWEMFSANQITLEQTWISEVKKINEISVDVVPVNSFYDEAFGDLVIIDKGLNFHQKNNCPKNYL